MTLTRTRALAASFSSRTSSPSRHVLLVEDSIDNQETLRLLLEAWGHRVDVASDGVAGVSKALAGRPEVAIIDIGLPLLNGNLVAERIRQALGKDIFLIALTAYSQEEDRRRAQEAGFDHFMTKPADLNELARLIAEKR